MLIECTYCLAKDCFDSIQNSLLFLGLDGVDLVGLFLGQTLVSKLIAILESFLALLQSDKRQTTRLFFS